MPRYFFSVVLNGQSTVDGEGQRFPDDSAARAHACHIAMLLADRCHDRMNSFVAVSGLDGRLAFKVPFQALGSQDLRPVTVRPERSFQKATRPAKGSVPARLRAFALPSGSASMARRNAMASSR